ncbi:MAG: fused MFS/spermidine synthase, partial [Caldilineaceae bacterium]|nr:fused MFS/spermidine synthase [Caldilineaceae bacterium]
AIDAYRPPYIPFHLTTVEFFRLVRDHLDENGVVAINVGRTATNYALVDALAATLYQLFPTVYAIDEPGPPDNLSNSLLIATRAPIELSTVRANFARPQPTTPAPFQDFSATAASQVRAVSPANDTAVFTDDHAPVEWVVHRIILDFMKGG